MFIARTQHVVQPKGQELTFSKCLCHLLFLCGVSKNRPRGEGGRWRGETLFSFHMYSQAIIKHFKLL